MSSKQEFSLFLHPLQDNGRGRTGCFSVSFSTGSRSSSLLQARGLERAVPGHTLPFAPVVGTSAGTSWMLAGYWIFTISEHSSWIFNLKSCVLELFPFLLRSICVVYLLCSFIFSFSACLSPGDISCEKHVGGYFCIQSVSVGSRIGQLSRQFRGWHMWVVGLTAFPGAVTGLSEVACGVLSLIFLFYLHGSQLVQLISPWPQPLYCLSPSIRDALMVHPQADTKQMFTFSQENCIPVDKRTPVWFKARRENT